MSEEKHSPTSDELFAGKSPFAAPPARNPADKTPAAPKRNRGRVILCSTAHPRILTNAGLPSRLRRW